LVPLQTLPLQALATTEPAKLQLIQANPQEFTAILNAVNAMLK
jgi:hypothetical protein